MAQIRQDRPEVRPEIVDAVLDLWGQAEIQHVLPVSGRSMLPLIQHGDQLRVLHGNQKIERGTIVVFNSPKGIIAHRVLAIYRQPGGPPVYLTKGDNCLAPDPHLKEDEIIGKVIGIQRGQRYLSIDTPRWNLLNRLISIQMLASTKILGQLRRVKQHTLGARADRMVGALSSCYSSLSSGIVKSLVFLVRPWKS